MNKVNFKKVVFGVSLGTVMALGSMSSAFASDINHPTAQTKATQTKAVGLKQQKQVKLSTQEQAKNVALQQYKGTVKDIKLNKENGKDVYNVVVHGQDGKDHRVKLDAGTGVTVNFTQEQIKAIALQQYPGTVKSIKLSNENGVDVYVIIINGTDGKEHTVKIKAATGEIVPYTPAATVVTVTYTQEQIRAIALQQYPGTVKSIKLSNENGIDVYVIIINGQDGKEHTVKINATTGAIVPFTQDEVKNIALQHYKGTVKDVQLNNENGKDVYNVVVHGQDGKDHRVKLDADTGVTVTFTQEQIKAIALQQYPGTVKSVKSSNENGVDIYVVIVNGQDGKEHTVKINAATGEVVPFTQNEVKDIAVKQYKGTVKDIKLNKQNGKDVYVIVVHGQDGKDHGVNIDAQTGEVC